MSFKEHNNRKIAKKMAEFITGQELRIYLSQKVEKYLGKEKITVFDGAIGSGQLEQYINVLKIYGTDIQDESVSAAKSNFQNTEIEVTSFFRYKKNIEVDAVIMNPPFSLKFNELSEEEKINIQKEFEWKKAELLMICLCLCH